MSIVEFHGGRITAPYLERKYSKAELAREYMRLLDELEATATKIKQDPRLLKLLNSAAAEADAFMDCHTTADGRWPDDDDKAEYYRQCTIIDDAREALGLRTGRQHEQEG